MAAANPETLTLQCVAGTTMHCMALLQEGGTREKRLMLQCGQPQLVTRPPCSASDPEGDVMAAAAAAGAAAAAASPLHSGLCWRHAACWQALPQ